MDIRIIPVEGIPEVAAGDDIGALIAGALRAAGQALAAGDVVVVAQKAVSKAEGRVVELAAVRPSEFARHVAGQTGKTPEEVEVILAESRRMVRMARGTLIMETRHGHICANAGVDRSNVAPGHACLLPVDPDASAAVICRRLTAEFGAPVAVVVADTFGRPWRLGQTNVAIGVAGMSPFADHRGQPDTYGREMRVTLIAAADELAGAAELVMGKTAQVPAAVVRGYPFAPGAGTAADLLRPADLDLFR